MTTPLPASARLAWWGTSWLRGHVVTDLLVDAVLDDDATHAVAGLPGSETTETLVSALGFLRTAGASAFGAAFPAEGDPVGLGGPAAFNADVLEMGEAVVVSDVGVGLVPHRTGAAITWLVQPARPRQLPDVGDADRELRAALMSSANDLARLDVARWNPEIADRLMNLRHLGRVVAPPGVPERCVDLAARGLQALGITELALEDHGAAISAHEIEQRRGALVPLARAGRRALTAACSPEVWPPG